MDSVSTLHAATRLLYIALASGLLMAAIRFASDHPSPAWLAKLHGSAAVAALTLLALGWTLPGALPGTGWGLALLGIAAIAGVALNLVFHGRQRSLPIALVFAHMSVAFIGLVIVFVVSISRPA